MRSKTCFTEAKVLLRQVVSEQVSLVRAVPYHLDSRAYAAPAEVDEEDITNVVSRRGRPPHECPAAAELILFRSRKRQTRGPNTRPSHSADSRKRTPAGRGPHTDHRSRNSHSLDDTQLSQEKRQTQENGARTKRHAGEDTNAFAHRWREPQGEHL